MGATAYFTHPLFSKHAMGEGHPECPERLSAIHDRLLMTGVMDALQYREAGRATPEQIARAHDVQHIQNLMDHHQRLLDSVAVGGHDITPLDPDTWMNVWTLEAALHAAGAAIAAVDAVIKGEVDNAFCAVRPPGHHATRKAAMGFCFFNNISIAARHACDHHGLQRVAIVDFDVHHGNGTEDIVVGDRRILMLGFFQQQLYPFSGETPLGSNIHNIPVPPRTRGADLRETLQDQWLPRLEAFRPEMLFISAGFDAHRDDDLGQLALTENDYAWMTEQLFHIAARHAKGRIVSCLEGGYNLRALACSVEQHVRTLAGI